MDFFDAILLLLLLGVLVVLVLGVVNMARGNNPQRSNKLMMWRVVLQGAALLLAALFLAKHSG